MLDMAFGQDRDRTLTPALAVFVVPLSSERTAIFFDTGPATLGLGDRLTATLDGEPLGGPVALTRLGLETGGQRHLLIVAYPSARLCAGALSISAGHVVIARIDPLALQSPLVDAMALVAGLDETGGLRLLRLLLTTGASLFGKGEVGEFGALAEQLVERLGVHVPLAERSPVGRDGAVLTWELPAEMALPRLEAVTLWTGARTRRLRDIATCEEVSGGRRFLHIFLDRPLPQSGELVAIGTTLLRLGVSSSPAAQPLSSWLARRNAATRMAARAFVDRLAAERTEVAILRAEIDCPAEAAPTARAVHLSRQGDGLLYLVSIDDPRGLLAGFRIEAEDTQADLRCDALVWHDRLGPVAAGYVPWSGPASGPATVAPVYRSGRIGPRQPASFDATNEICPEAFRSLPESAAADVLAAALPGVMRGRPDWRCRVAEFGSAKARPSVSVVIAASEPREHLHALLAAIVTEPGATQAEIVLYHPDGAQTSSVLATADALSAIHRVGLRVVSVASGAMPSECLRAALRVARADRAVILGQGILPTRRGWLSAWRRRAGASRASFSEIGEGGHVAALGGASLAAMRSSKASLPSVLADLHAVPAARAGRAGSDGFAVFSDDLPDPLQRAVEGRALATLRETSHD
ncbi:hypothetical protein LX81_01759 [Palleronia aestuarii]|uniref:Uncharacterized protein n=1 Tax=Palleronia aestuarii TaxID=568105 RepID=A0A2W7NG23_9RHOB|nr:hypothetical protein [Palleronia aestuarii]PZX17127.1 hypothetical protein LX81_01759 [Palleronia aestuarii]